MPLPEGFEWDSFDVDNDEALDELRLFLEEHYIESQSGTFRLRYTNEKLRYGLKIPGYRKDGQFMIRASKNKKIMAFTMMSLREMIVNGKKEKFMEVNFLAVHFKLRSKRLAQICI